MSSQPHPARDSIPVGDIELHDNYLPGLPAGDYTIKVTHDLRTGTGSGASSIIDGGQFEAVQRFTVRGPQVAIDPGAVLACQPPDSSSGRFAEVLPHVVLGDPMLPWERTLDDALPDTPWLALLVLTDDQLLGATGDPTRTITATVADLLAPDADVLKPDLRVEADIAADAPCCYIQVTATAFEALVPRLDEVRLLAHARGANTGDRPILGIDEDGLFSVVVANRFPATPAPGSTEAVKNIVHLVSLEGHRRILVEQPDFGGHDAVALLSLCRWSFWSYADRAADFRALAEGLTRLPDSSNPAPRERMWLRLPHPDLGESPAQRQIAGRLDAGYVPLPYVTRSGETTFGWYRGPLTPVVPVDTPEVMTATTADALIGYDPVWGGFDVALAAAFELGRALAVADSVFAQQVMSVKRAARAVVDSLYQQFSSTHAPAGGSAVRAFGALLDGHLLSTLGAPPTPATAVWHPPAPGAPSGDLKQDLARFLRADDTVAELRDALTGQLADQLAPVTDWLAQRMLLHGIPFHHIVPDERMLPVESLRMFYLDAGWVDALVSGAFGIGAQSSRDTEQDRIIAATVRDAAARRAAAHRDTVRAAAARESTAASNNAAQQRVSGFLLRSAIVSGWPNLAVRGYGSDARPLPVLRLDHLSPSVLLCLFDGIPAVIELRQPQEGFQFGVDDSGIVPLRNLLPPSRSPGGMRLGDPFEPEVPFQVGRYLRAESDCRVLDLKTLVGELDRALAAAHGQSVGPLGPADLALQMVRVPEAIEFTGPDRTAEH